jgi:hypothetical protein
MSVVQRLRSFFDDGTDGLAALFTIVWAVFGIAVLLIFVWQRFGN